MSAYKHRLHRLLSGLLVLGAIVISSDALAQQSQPAAAPTNVNAGLLGQFEGIVTFCSLANPASAGLYRTSLRQLTGGFGDHALDETRGSAAYRQSFNGIIQMLASVPTNQRKQACSSFFAPSKT